MRERMWKARQHFLILGFLIVAVCGKGTLASEQNETWACVCGPICGPLGTQLYTGDEKLGFTECSCPTTAGDCPVCPEGQVLSPLHDHNESCVCTSPLFVIIRLVQLRLSNYTQSLEKTFINYLASYLQLSPSQMIPSARRNGSVILDMYIFSPSQDQEYLSNARNLLLQRNSTQDGGAWDPSIGPWNLLHVGNVSSKSGQPYGASDFGGKLLLLVLVLCATITVALLLTSLILLVYTKRKSLRHPTMFWFKGDNSSSGFRTLLSHCSSPTEKFQVYDNTCFNGSTGCIGRRSFKTSSKMGPLLGMVTRQFSYSELQEATGGFCKSNVIGVGGSSSVYKGGLKDGRDVAIKKLNTKCGPGLDREFLLEVELLSRLHHFHLVPLVGYCIETHGTDVERLLVYEYMPNGNLRERLDQPFGKENLNWAARLRIALGAARGLEYLHEAAEPRVLHRDFKSSNLLLDAKWRAKVADFGMAAIVKEMDSNACPSSPAQMLGTFGYFAPEYAMMGRATVKSDVFSFGVVLLELISGRKPVEKSVPFGQESLVVWALPLLRNNTRLVNELVDPALQQVLPVDDARKMAYLAWLCLQMDPESRPTMTFVVQVLATLIPENSIRMSEFGPLMEARDQVPQLLSWTQDYSFSRDNNSSPTMSSIVVDQCGLVPLRCGNGQMLVLDSEQETMRIKKGESTKKFFTSTSLSPAEYLEKFTAMTSSGEMKKSTEEEADLVKPRLEYFWQNNGLVVQVQSPAR